ncbi:MAG: threonine--tRNA ligase [Candidatus Paceibacterota bacterium]
MNEMKLGAIRHTLAHLLAQAVKERDPKVKFATGPATETGFYYDFKLSKELGEANLEKLEKGMRLLLKENLEPKVETLSEEDARELFKDQPYKLEIIDEIVGNKEKISIYTIGEFTDLCEGPHVENTKEIDPDAFKLTRIAGAYWKGDENNTMLTRIYGLAFSNKKELEEYEKQQEEARARDHRKLGKELDLFTFSDLVGPGLPLFTPRGTLMRDLIVDKITSIQSKYGYEKVTIPHLAKRELYQTSGHWEKFGDELFKVYGKGDTEFIMKPMNCPHHTQIYASKPRSYKDLPIRYTETTMVYRDEQQGELIGLGRVRSITQDDGHVFCTPEQVKQEVKNIVKIVEAFYASLGMYKKGLFWVSLSVRDPDDSEGYLGKPEQWENAENALKEIAEELELPYTRVEGEAAFYGPKLDFMFFDALGRERQLATAQLDFMMPERFGLSYIDENGEEKTPVMIHRAIAGSLERFMAIMIEHFAGAFPLWLSPIQIKVLPVSEHFTTYAEGIVKELKEADFRVEIDESNETLGKKIRNVKTEKVPYFLVLGEREESAQQVTLESRDKGKIGSISINALIERLQREMKEKK